MMLGKADIAIVQHVRTAVVDLSTPALGLVTGAFDAAETGAERLGDLAAVLDENAALKTEINAMREWRRRAINLGVENAELRNLLNLRPDPTLGFVSGRVVADRGGSFVRSVVVDVGDQHGVGEDQAVLSPEGFIGRTVEVGRWSSRILLATDLNSRIPVQIQPRGWRGVMAGDNSERPKLLYLAEIAKFEPGDQVVTSGHGGVFPPGLPVGVVEPTPDPEAPPRIRLFDDHGRLTFVRIVQFGEAKPLDGAPGPRVAERGSPAPE
ncbi:MAG: rod shape-determining protein MreC [Pseudomonadota bacterium]